MSSARIKVDRLRLELARRGWHASDLASAASVSAPTITSAMNGRPVSARTIAKIARALLTAPVIAGVEELLVGAGE
jgi:transcriptional regulator with XRE-family HTH domain